MIFIRPLLTRAEDVAEAIRSAVQEMSRELPVQAVFMSAQDQGGMAGSGVPTYQYPEDAARTLGQVMRHVAWRSSTAPEPPEFNDVRTEEAAAVIANALRSGREWVGFDETARLLECYGVAIPEWRLAPSPEQAGQAAEELGGQVVLKAQGSGLLHKTEMGAVRIGLTGNAKVTRAAEEMDEAIARAGAQRQDFIVQGSPVDSGVELLVGVVNDATFGPVLACGAGKARRLELAEGCLGPDPPHRTGRGEREGPAPSTTSRCLQGFAAAPEWTSMRSTSFLLRVGAMVEAHHEIAELDLNPGAGWGFGRDRGRLPHQGCERSATAAVASYLALAFGLSPWLRRIATRLGLHSLEALVVVRKLLHVGEGNLLPSRSGRRA